MLQTKSKYFIPNVRYHGNPNIKGQLPQIKQHFSSILFLFSKDVYEHYLKSLNKEILFAIY